MKQHDDLKTDITHVEFANAILQSKRNAIGLSVDQIQHLAGVILVLEHDLEKSQTWAAQMMVEASSAKNNAVMPQPPAERQSLVKVFIEGKSPVAAARIESFLSAYDAYKKAQSGPDENFTRLKFEKAAIQMVSVYKPRG